MMNITVGNLLCNQSPALFVLAFFFLISFFVRKKNHKVKAGFDMLFFIVSLVLAVGLYFLGMAKEYFTIKDFYEIRISGWIGLIAVTVLIIVTLVRRVVHKVDSYKKARQEAKMEKEGLVTEADPVVQEIPVYQETVVAAPNQEDEAPSTYESEITLQISDTATVEDNNALEDVDSTINLTL